MRVLAFSPEKYVWASDTLANIVKSSILLSIRTICQRMNEGYNLLYNQLFLLSIPCNVPYLAKDN